MRGSDQVTCLLIIERGGEVIVLDVLGHQGGEKDRFA